MIIHLFQYTIQLDSEEKITNTFLADAKMLIDCALFGDAITFDTTYSSIPRTKSIDLLEFSLDLVICGKL